MKYTISLLFFLLTGSFLHAQEKVILSHAINAGDFIEISLELENKPNDKFHLIKIDTITAVTDKNEMLINNGNGKNIFRPANDLIRYHIPSKKFNNLTAKGILKYFTPTKDNKSYFSLGDVKTLKKNINLIPSDIAKKNQTIWFSIVDSVTINKAFPGFKYRFNEAESFKKIDFAFYDLIYAYRTDKNQDFVLLINDDIDAGYDNLTLKDRNNGMTYKLIKLKKQMSASEREAINIKLLIENESSIKRIPFEFKNVKLE